MTPNRPSRRFLHCLAPDLGCISDSTKKLKKKILMLRVTEWRPHVFLRAPLRVDVKGCGAQSRHLSGPGSGAWERHAGPALGTIPGSLGGAHGSGRWLVPERPGSPTFPVWEKSLGAVLFK